MFFSFARIGPPAPFPHVHIVSASVYWILFLPGLSLHGVGIHLRQTSKKSGVVLLQNRCSIIRPGYCLHPAQYGLQNHGNYSRIRALKFSVCLGLSCVVP
ncbi:hypothetical protein Pelo_19774 [Pelomyxa schiedti]|nr:hypothetical protein Pelo_19774 [Pelomyxa schiedti]